MKKIKALISLLLLVTFLSGCGKQMQVSGTYYETIKIPYDASYFSQDEIENMSLVNPESEGFVNAYLLTGNYIKLENGIVESTNMGEGTYEIINDSYVNIHFANGENEQYWIDGLCLKIKGVDSEYYRGVHKSDLVYYNENSEDYKLSLQQKQNLVLKHKNEIVFEIQDKKGNKVLDSKDIISIGTYHSPEGEYLSDFGMQIDFNYYMVDYLSQYVGEEMTVMYYGNPIMTFEMRNIDPALTIGLGYKNSASFPAVNDLVDKLTRELYDIDTEENPWMEPLKANQPK